MTGIVRRVSVVWAVLPHAGSPYALLRAEVARVCGVRPRQVELAKMCGQCGSEEHGRPYVVQRDEFAAPQVSLSRAGRLALVAVTDCGPVGVDVESADAPSYAGFDGVALHPDEEARSVRDRAITWVRKESLLKATGHGLMLDPRQVRLSGPGQPPRLVEWRAASPPPLETWMHDAAVRPSHVACVAVLCRERPEFNVREEVREGSLPQASP